ncbi:helicase-exonuclease AddAB subunit AddA [Ectobacillus sp. sgz5001026]|uniref:helicase-exonuclease AddAB subunit AddA n=1 Tax=Ectobacillus sp. sgz5001026 TaxID=3242473 RepID=UPI0036D26CD2
MTEIGKPQDSQWTDEQWKAITEADRDILVAAAAGSGKTAVLVERIIKKIVTGKQDVDRLLVVTFTNASAQEMKKRIGEALEKELSSHEDSYHLRKQLTLLNRASISTLHSFCLQVIRSYYFMISLDPGFRIANETEIELLKEEVLGDLLEEQYGTEQNDLFFELVDMYTNDRSDDDIQKMILRLLLESRAHPSPNAWLDQLVSMYDVEGKTIEELPYTKTLLNDTRITLQGAYDCIKKALLLTTLPDGPVPRASVFEGDQLVIQSLLDAASHSWTETYELMQQVKWATLPRIKKSEYDEELLSRTEKLRNKAKEMVKNLKEECFSRSPVYFIQDILKMKPVLAKLVELVKEFSVRFQASKSDKGIVDFTDLEHYCLEILSDSSDGMKPSSAAIQYQDKFLEVLVDEYQDTNMVQERILQLVTKESERNGNLFMVGDVKQSIYRFRLAEPGLFLGKYKAFTPDGKDGGMRIDLAKNFRSRQEVLAGTNFIFRQIMGETVGEIEYNADAELKLGASYPESKNAAAEWVIIDQHKEDSDEEEDEQTEWEASQLEARFLARRIKEMVASGYEVFDRKTNTMRPVSYRDFVILLRSMPWAPVMVEECKQLGIPVYAELSTGYFAATEIHIMLNVLRVIDNPAQDIPLASVLRSPIVGVTDEELANLRIFKKRGSFYQVLLAYLHEGDEGENMYEKISSFYELLQEWRSFARQQPLSDLIWKIYRETGYYDFVAGLPSGKQRQANLRVLYDRARQYEATSFRGLFRFLRFIERIVERGDDMGTARSIGEQEDVVRIMTIHKSKGLEFPIVFVAGLNRQFNVQDLNRRYLLHKDLGFGSPFIDPKKRIQYKTLPQLAIKRKMKLDLIAEEMRVLYVALTRAKEKLILIGTVKDMEDSLSKWRDMREHENWLLPDYIRAGSSCYMDWIGYALLRHKASSSVAEFTTSIPSFVYNDDSSWTIRPVQAAILSPAEQLDDVQRSLVDSLQKHQEVDVISDKHDEVLARLTWTYPFQAATEHRAKQTVTEIKRNYQIEEEGRTSSQAMTPIGTRPRFMERTGLTGAEYGTAVHLVMQHISLREMVTTDYIEELLAKMVNNELLTYEQAVTIVPQDIVTFFHSPLGQRMLNGKTEREVPFSMTVHASESYADWNGREEEEVLVQGVIDCMIEEEDGIVLIDFKTDRITGKFPGGFEQARSELLKRYEMQLVLYSKAVEEGIHKKVKEKYLYFFDGHHILQVD